MIARIALRNVTRHGRRSLLSAITIAVGVLFFMTLDSLYSGLDRDAIDNMISLSTAAFKVRTPEYQADHETLPLQHGVPDAPQVVAMLERIPSVVGVAPRTRFLAQLSDGRHSLPVQGVVVDPGKDPQVFALKEHLTGAFFQDDGGGLVLGGLLARDLGLKLGDTVTLYARTRYDAHNAVELAVVGLLETTDPALNRGTAFISYATAESLLELEGLVTEICVALKRRANLRAMEADTLEAQRSVQAILPGLVSESYLEQGAAFLNVSRQKKSFAYVMLGVILLIAAVGIFNTVMMSVYERIREVGVLRAHGMTPGQILQMFLLEGALIGVLGAMLGCAAGGLATWLLVTQGLPVDRMFKDLDVSGMPIWGTLYGEWNPATPLFGGVFAVVMATLAAAIPARQASRLTVTRALRFV